MQGSSLIAFLGLLVAIMSLLFGERLVDLFGVPEDTVRQVIVVFLLALVFAGIAGIVLQANELGAIDGTLNLVGGIIVLGGFAFDLVTSFVGAEIILGGGGPATAMSMGGSLGFTVLLFVVTLTHEAGFRGVMFPVWIYIPLFVIAAFFDVLTSALGFFRFFGESEVVSLRGALLVFASILVFACQFLALKLFRGVLLFSPSTQAASVGADVGDDLLNGAAHSAGDSSVVSSPEARAGAVPSTPRGVEDGAS